MGLLSDKLGGHPKLREILKWGKEFAVIAVFIYMALNLRTEWQAGYDECKREGVWNAEHNFSTTGGYNASGNSTFPLNFTKYNNSMTMPIAS
jgi:hypothetical protein